MAARLAFEQRRLDSEERVHKEMLQERATKRVDRQETEEHQEKRDMDRMKVFMEFSNKAIVSAVKETTRKD